MCAVVHEPGIVCRQHHVPAVTLGRIFQIRIKPRGIFHQAALCVIPVVSVHTGDAHHVHRIALRTQAGNGGLWADRVWCHVFKRVWMQDAQAGGCGGR